jgi:S1-C subfamily serine protease
MLTEKENYKTKYRRFDLNKKRPEGGGGWTGIVLVPNVVERTPPYVDVVEPNSPAQKAGLKPDDLIVYVDGLPVAHINAYRDVIDKYRPGTEVKLEVRRGDRLQTFAVKLEAPPKAPEKETPKTPEK